MSQAIIMIYINITSFVLLSQQSSNSYYIVEAVLNRRGRLQEYTR